MSPTKSRNLLHTSILIDDGLYFLRRNIFPAPANSILFPVNKKEVLVFVLTKQVTGMKPAVSPGFSRGRRHRIVTMTEGPAVVRSDYEFANFTPRDRLVVLINESAFNARTRFSTATEQRRIEFCYEYERQFGHAVTAEIVELALPRQVDRVL